MAALMKYTCNNCAFSVENWSDGSSYIQFPNSERQYFYHPGEDMVYDYMEKFLGHVPSPEEKKSLWEKYVSHEGEFICKTCLKSTELDPVRDPVRCSHCHSKQIMDADKLEKAPCFKCNKGHFDTGEMVAIS